MHHSINLVQKIMELFLCIILLNISSIGTYFLWYVFPASLWEGQGKGLGSKHCPRNQ